MERDNLLGSSRFILQTGTPEGVAGPSSSAAPEAVDPDAKSPIDEPSTGFVQPPPAFFIKRQGFRPYALYEGREPPKEHLDEGKLLDLSDEGWVKTDSYYTEAGGLARTARMYKMKDEDKNRNSWFSSDRTLEDFQGNKYKFDTTVVMNHLTIINLSDNTTVATFKRPVAGVTHQGTLEIQQPVTLEFLHLLLGACYIKYLTDQRRRAWRHSGGGGGGTSGG
ncbi:hypothetical protein M407DRAFT_200080 [Tulasnella calospora MUT 4182]|uniref:Uncharacterized protein n=1 Tax=Tulasnella calospora MUT 4182 TaxID=1051891 RepID=A0A0C3KYW6_9AGAM|nr:hypothetical protein M407DRAFT_200080 [Tulasnella calospora MUT 4182]